MHSVSNHMHYSCLFLFMSLASLWTSTLPSALLRQISQSTIIMGYLTPLHNITCNGVVATRVF